MLIQNQCNKLILLEFYLNWAENKTIFSIVEEVKTTLFHFSERAVKVLRIDFVLMYYQYKITEYNSLNIKLSNSQLNKVKSATKSITEVL